MTEDAPKIQVRKPAAYEEIPTPSPNGAAPEPSRPESTRLRLRPIESPESGSTDLIEAVGTVFRAVTTRIAFHENEARRLREALAPFANLARQSGAPVPATDGGTLEALLRIAEELKQGDSP